MNLSVQKFGTLLTNGKKFFRFIEYELSQASTKSRASRDGDSIYRADTNIPRFAGWRNISRLMNDSLRRDFLLLFLQTTVVFVKNY